MAMGDESVEGAGWPPNYMRVSIVYRNHRGVVGVRRILPRAIRFGSSEWHPGPQWLLEALDTEKDRERTFAMRDIIRWGV